MQTLVVDDEPEARRLLGRMLADLGVAVAAEAGSAEEALAVLDRRPVDAALLDIRLPQEDGLALGDSLRRRGVAIAFVSGFPDYALTTYELDAVDYLVKPVSRDRLGRALARLQARRAPPAAGVDRLCLRDGTDRVLLPVGSVLYLRRDGPITTVETDQRSLTVREPLERLEQVLRPHGFFRAHRAFLVNLRRARRIVPWSRDAQSLMLDDAKETVVPLAKSRIQELRSRVLWP